MTPRKYRVDMYWSEEDGLYLAEVPELPGCLTHGETIAEAARNAEEAIEGWIETAGDMGWPIPRPSVEKHYSGRFLARVPRSLHARLAQAAERDGVSLNQYIVSKLSGTQTPDVPTLASSAPPHTTTSPTVVAACRTRRKPTKATAS
jgi:antitoxin HicB